MSLDNVAFEVNKTDITNTQFVETAAGKAESAGDVVLKIDKYALTANNITYAVTGDILGYWRFFPTSEGWGRVPAMGFAEVVDSKCDGIDVGERVWGWFPMTGYLTIKAGKVSENGFSDISEYREGLSPVYSRFERVTSNPFYDKSTEDYQMLIKGLFTTSWLIDDFMADNQYFGAQQYIITSASSKTSLALAFAVKARGEKLAIGLTSESRVEFVKSLDLYDQVLSYQDVEQLDSGIPSVVVDMAGSKQVLSNIHHHFTNNIKFSSRVGATHVSDLAQELKLPGAEPTMFFAPHQVEKRSKEWGPDKLQLTIGKQLQKYIEFIRNNIAIEYIKTPEVLQKSYLAVLSGNADASKGLIVCNG